MYNESVELERTRLREVSRRLLRLHRLLLDRERLAYEGRHGTVTSGELLGLLLNDEGFAWLRSLSTLVAQIDALTDGDAPLTPEDAQAVYREAHRLLKSGDNGLFQDRYRDALQESPDVVMAHADVSALLPPTERGPRDRG